LSAEPVKLKVGRHTLEGYSIAGDQTAIRVADLNVCFDVGKAPPAAVRSPVVLLSHAHQDHLAGVSYYFSNRNFRAMSCGLMVVPEAIRADLTKLMRLWRKLEGYRIPFRFKGVRAGQRFGLRPRLEALAFETRHLVPSLGYCVLEVRQKLMRRYEGWAPERIKAIARRGKPVSRNVRVPIVTYLGDTQLAGLNLPPVVGDSEVLIAECTFIRPDHQSRAAAGRHTHAGELAAFLESVDCEHIVLHHFSSRYRPSQIRQMLSKALPASVWRRVHLFLPR
jgi:ribonuclease Z